MKFIFLFFLLLVSACSSIQKQGDQTEFKKFWNAALNNAIRDLPDDTERFKLFEDTLLFQGNVIEDDCNRLKKILTSSVKTLVVNSQGGLVSEALCMAKHLKKNKVNRVVVRGVCWSSCANYLFLGVENRIIERGTVGFHGNMVAMSKRDGVYHLIKKYFTNTKLNNQEMQTLTQSFNFASTNRLSSTQIKILKKFSNTLYEEEKFISDHNLPQSLFERSQKLDKGTESGTKYLFLMPSTTSLKRYGITVVGEQDEVFIKAFNEKYPVPLLFE